MAWNPKPEVAAARDFGKKFKAKQVVIIFVTENNQLGYASYGKTKALCAETRELGDHLFECTEEYFRYQDEEMEAFEREFFL
jgi:hypothetical protein